MTDYAESNNPVQKTWQELYIEFLANPSDIRTDKEFCQSLGLDPATLRLWKYKYLTEIYAEAVKRRNKYLNQFRVEALKALSAKFGKSVDAIKVALQWCGELVEKHEYEHKTPEDKLRKLNALIENLSKNKKAWDEKDGKKESPA